MMGTVYPDTGQVSEHLIKCLQGQLLTVTLQSHSKSAPFLFTVMYKSIQLAAPSLSLGLQH